MASEHDAAILATIIGHQIHLQLAGKRDERRLICSNCWAKTSHLDWRAVRDITYADLLYPAPDDLRCWFCHVPLSWVATESFKAEPKHQEEDKMSSAAHEHFMRWRNDRLICDTCHKSEREIELEQQLAQAKEEIALLTDQLRFTSDGLAKLQRLKDGYMEQAMRARVIFQHLAGLDRLPNGEALLTARVLGEQAREILKKMEASDERSTV